jgi:hypothetical protein
MGYSSSSEIPLESAVMAAFEPPGRIGDPGMTLSTEPRLHAGLLQTLKQLGIHELAYLTSDVTADAPLEDIRTVVEENERSIDELLRAMNYSKLHTSHTIAGYGLGITEHTVSTTHAVRPAPSTFDSTIRQGKTAGIHLHGLIGLQQKR